MTHPAAYMRWASFLLLAMTLVLFACNNEGGIKPRKKNLEGTYVGKAEVIERYYLNGTLIRDTAFVLEDVLHITEIDRKAYRYSFSLDTEMDEYLNVPSLIEGEWPVDSTYYSWWEGFEPSSAYAYDYKKHWIFKPKEDSVFFRLAHYPYEPWQVDRLDVDGNPTGYYDYHEHEWDYILRAKR